MLYMRDDLNANKTIVFMVSTNIYIPLAIGYRHLHRLESSFEVFLLCLFWWETIEFMRNSSGGTRRVIFDAIVHHISTIDLQFLKKKFKALTCILQITPITMCKPLQSKFCLVNNEVNNIFLLNPVFHFVSHYKFREC